MVKKSQLTGVPPQPVPRKNKKKQNIKSTDWCSTSAMFHLTWKYVYSFLFERSTNSLTKVLYILVEISHLRPSLQSSISRIALALCSDNYITFDLYLPQSDFNLLQDNAMYSSFLPTSRVFLLVRRPTPSPKYLMVGLYFYQ